jgi:hypothetical protein
MARTILHEGPATQRDARTNQYSWEGESGGWQGGWSMRVSRVRLTHAGLYVDLAGIDMDREPISHDGGVADDGTAGDGR